MEQGKYIYCIIASKEAESFGPIGIGGRGDELYTILFDDIAAVVSNSPIISYSVSRDNMLTHEKAIEEIMKKHTVLPVRFNTIAEDENKVKRILGIEHSRCIDLLKNIEGKKELGLKAMFSAVSASGGKEDIYEEILRESPDIRALKEKIRKLPPAKTHYQRMEIGKMVENALKEKKDFYKEDILKSLEPLAREFKINKTYGERMILNAAFLVEEAGEKEFDRQVDKLDEKYTDKIKFKYVGSVAPFNFVDLTIDTSALRSIK